MKFPSTKDYIYWLFIALIAITVVIVWRSDSPKYLMDEISLGATIISILLAVIAILFTIIQSTESTRQSFDMVKEINKLTSQMINLTAMNEQLTQEFKEKKVKYEEVIDGFIQNDQSLKSSKILWNVSENSNTDNAQSTESSIGATITVSTNLQEKAILNFLNYNYNQESPVNIQVLWKDLYDNKLNLDMNTLKDIINVLELKGRVKVMREDSETWVNVKP